MLNVVGEAEGVAIIASSAKFADIINYSMSVEVNEHINEIEDEYQIIVKNKNDILNEMDFENEEERVLCDDIITNLEKMIADSISSMKVAQIPFIGCVRINPIKRKLRDSKLHLSNIRKSLTKEQYKEHVRSFVIDMKEKQKQEDRNKVVFHRIRSNNKKRYEELFKRCGRAYAELFIMSVYWMKEVPYDADWEFQYQVLSGRINEEDYD